MAASEETLTGWVVSCFIDYLKDYEIPWCNVNDVDAVMQHYFGPDEEARINLRHRIKRICMEATGATQLESILWDLILDTLEWGILVDDLTDFMITQHQAYCEQDDCGMCQ